MLLLELLMVVFAQLVAMVGPVGAFLVVAVLVVIAVILANLLVRFLVSGFFGFGTSPTARRRLSRNEAVTRRELRRAKRIDAMNDEVLRRWVDTHRRDAFALSKWCERLREKGDIATYARERERLLSLDCGWDVQEKSTDYHLLADLYLGPLKRPDEARRVLSDFLRQFPDSREARFTRERLRRIEAASRPQGGEGEPAVLASSD